MAANVLWLVPIHYDNLQRSWRTVGELDKMLQPLDKQTSISPPKWAATSQGLASVHPDGLQHPRDCGGAPFISVSTIRLRGNTNIGGKCVPEADIAQITVTVLPRSPLVILLTCFAPFEATIFPGSWTVDIPVSSMFHTWLGRYSRLCSSCLYNVKNSCTFDLLKPTARDKFVPCGLRTDRSRNRAKNPRSQSLPALSFLC